MRPRTPRKCANLRRSVKRQRVFHFSRPHPDEPDSIQLSEAIRQTWQRLEELKPTTEDRCVFDVLYNHSFGLNRFFAEISFEKLAESATVSIDVAMRTIEKFQDAEILAGGSTNRPRSSGRHKLYNLLH